MGYFIEELKQNRILSKSDVVELRKEINRDNPEMDSKEKASLLSHAIYRAIDNNLDGFSDSNRIKIRKKLINKLVYENKEFIDKLDVFFTCTRFENKSNELINDLIKWVNNNVEETIEKKDINRYILNEAEFIKKDSEIEGIKNKKEGISKLFKRIIDFQVYKNIWSKIHIFLINSLEDIKKYFYIIINKKKVKEKIFLVLCIIMLFGIISISRYISSEITFNSTKQSNIAELNEKAIKYNLIEPEAISTTLSPLEKETFLYYEHIPNSLRYKAIDREKLKKYLKSRNSILEQEPYFTTIIDTSEKFGLNAIVLFAITGQEQGFVPINHKNSKKMANNPFNVYGSWKKYNTSIEKSSEVAARTICRLLIDKPKNMNPFKWINRKYAEDPNWWKGVSKIFNDMTDRVSENIDSKL